MDCLTCGEPVYVAYGITVYEPNSESIKGYLHKGDCEHQYDRRMLPKVEGSSNGKVIKYQGKVTRPAPDRWIICPECGEKGKVRKGADGQIELAPCHGSLYQPHPRTEPIMVGPI